MVTHSHRGVRRTHYRCRRLLATALLSGMALVLVTSHAGYALSKTECELLGGGTIVEGGKMFCCVRNHGGVDLDCTIPVTVAGALSPTPLTPAPPAPKTPPSPITPAVRVPPPIQVRKADLVPSSNSQYGAGPAGFCDKDSAGKLVVHVKNQGLIAAPASKTVIRFLRAGKARPALVDTHGIPAGGTVTLPGIEIPAGACGPDCPFTITVDVPNTIDESNETNNIADGLCLG